MYLVFGVLTTLVSWVVRFGILWPGKAIFSIEDELSVQYTVLFTVASVISWICAVLFAFFTNRAYVFKDADKKAADKLEDIVRGLGIHAERGVVTSGDQFIAGKEAKDKIKSLFPDAACCEMEGGAIGHCAYVNGVPFVVVRAISDKADGTGSMDYLEFCDVAAKNSINVISEFVKTY